jgi:hypothetical protein
LVGAAGGLLRRLPPDVFAARWVLFLAVAVLYSLHEIGVVRMPRPQRQWQVPPAWRVYYHPFVTAAGYGFLLGFGILTRIVVSTFYLLLLWDLLMADPVRAAEATALFGFAQTLPLLIAGWSVTSIEDVHRVADKSWSLRPLVHRLNGVVLAFVAGGMLVTAFPRY